MRFCAERFDRRPGRRVSAPIDGLKLRVDYAQRVDGGDWASYVNIRGRDGQMRPSAFFDKIEGVRIVDSIDFSGAELAFASRLFEGWVCNVLLND